MTLEEIRHRLAAHEPVCVGESRVARAAVALVLCQTESDVDVLLIRRAVRDGDPWSGHMAFPGGRRDPGDPDMVHTALRETCEEVGIDLFGNGRVIGRLDELRAMAHHRPLDLVISPVVCELLGPAELALDPREVESAVWVPLSFFWSPEARAVHRRTFDGTESLFPAYRYGSYVVWGLTHRILEGFLEIASPAAGRG